MKKEIEKDSEAEKKAWNALLDRLVNTLEEMVKRTDEANAELEKVIESGRKKREGAKKN